MLAVTVADLLLRMLVLVLVLVLPLLLVLVLVLIKKALLLPLPTLTLLILQPHLSFLLLVIGWCQFCSSNSDFYSCQIYLLLAIPVLGWYVTIFNLASTNFNLQWTKLYSVVNQYAKFYIVEVKCVQGTVRTLETVPGNTTSTVIERLKPSTKYRVGVFGIDSVGQPYKSLESVTTTKEGKRQ